MPLTMKMCADSLMLYSLRLFKGHVHFFSSLTPSALSNPPPPLCRLWSIQPCLPVPHVIFFLWHSSPLPTAWYSGVGMHAPSQIHQLRSECRTTAWGNGGMRGERERWRKKRGRDGGRERGQVSGLSTSFRDQSLKLTGRKREEWERTRVKARKYLIFISEGWLLLISISFQISLSEEFNERPSPASFRA